MCHLSQPVQSPNPAGDENPNAGDPNVSGPMSSAPATTTTQQPTKFAKLLKMVVPLAVGGLQGGFGGNWHVPGSGFEAQQGAEARQRQFGMQQQDLELRRQMLQREMYNAQSLDAYRRAGEEKDRAMEQYYTSRADLADKPKHRIESTDAGLMDIDEDTGQAHPVENMEPEKTGSLPMPNESEVAPLQPYVKPAPTKPAPGFTLGQGQERFDASGKKIATGEAKTFAPRSPRSGSGTSAADRGKVETYAEELVKQLGDPQKALDAVEGLKSLDPGMKAAVRQRIREMQRPAKTGRKIPAFTPDQMKAMTQAPPG